jgi:hypothetical protein
MVYTSEYIAAISAAKHTAPPIKHSPEVNIFSTAPIINSARPPPDSAAVIRLSFVIIDPSIVLHGRTLTSCHDSTSVAVHRYRQQFARRF